MDDWKRKNTYSFFKEFDNPFFQLTVNLPVGKLKEYSRKQHTSLMLSLYYLSQKAVNSIQGLNCRIEEGGVVQYEESHVSTTVLKADKTFGIVALESAPTFAEFSQQARQQLEATRLSPDLFYGPNPNNVIHYTTIPWVSFTAIQHVRKFHIGDSSPKVAFGKLFQQAQGSYIPLALDVHHALAYGYHAGLFFERLEEFVSKPDSYLSD